MKTTYHGSCHCGAVHFACDLDLGQGTSKCNCSICAKVRFWKAIAKAGDFHLKRGEDSLAEYRFGSNSIAHRFCRHCGVKVFGQGNMETLGGVFYAVNIACLDDVPLKSLVTATVMYEDGRHDNWQSPPAIYRHL